MGVNGIAVEISPRQVYVARQAMMLGAACRGLYPSGANLASPDVSHPTYHNRKLVEKWDHFPWQDEDHPHVLAWKQGRTGIPLIDAAMREIYVTGYMHNRGRMNVGSYLTKHLLTGGALGKDGLKMVDWDPALNALVAVGRGSGPDDAYFHYLIPLRKPKNLTMAAPIAMHGLPRAKNAQTALDFYDAIPQAWNLHPDMRYPDPIVDLSTGEQPCLRKQGAYI